MPGRQQDFRVVAGLDPAVEFDFDLLLIHVVAPRAIELAHVDVRKLDGPWSYDVNQEQVEIELNSRIEASDDAKILLSARHGFETDTLAFKRTFVKANFRSRPYYDFAPTSQLIVIANGSFLVNVQLVNKAHRKL